MKRSILNKRWLGIGMASSLLAGVASVALADPTVYNSSLPAGWTQAMLWTFDASYDGWGGDAYLPGGLSAFAPNAWSAAQQSPQYNPSFFGTGGVNMSGALGPTAAGPTTAATWSRGHPGYNGSGIFNAAGQDPANYNAFVFDYNVSANTPLDGNGQLPTFTVWFQFGVGTDATTGNPNNNGGTVPLQVAMTADGNWHTMVIPSIDFQISDGSGNYTEPTFADQNLRWLHDMTIGVSDSSYAANVTINSLIDNVGFAEVVPEPASVALLGMGLAALGLTVRRKLFRS